MSVKPKKSGKETKIKFGGNMNIWKYAFFVAMNLFLLALLIGIGFAVANLLIDPIFTWVASWGITDDLIETILVIVVFLVIAIIIVIIMILLKKKEEESKP